MVEGKANDTWMDDEKWRNNANGTKIQRLTFMGVTKKNMTKQWSKGFGSGTRSAHRKFANGESAMGRQRRNR